MCTAIRLHNGYYKFGKQVLKYSRIEKIAKKRGIKWVHIIEAVSGTHVDTIEVID